MNETEKKLTQSLLSLYRKQVELLQGEIETYSGIAKMHGWTGKNPEVIAELSRCIAEMEEKLCKEKSEQPLNEC